MKRLINYLLVVFVIVVILEFTVDLPWEGQEFWVFAFMISAFLSLAATTFENFGDARSKLHRHEHKRYQTDRGLRK